MEPRQAVQDSATRDRRQGRSAWPAIRRAGAVLCAIPAAYLLLTPAYAMLHIGDYASDMPRLLRYVIGPLIIALALLWAGLRLGSERALTVGIVATSVLAGLFLFETYLTLRLLPRQGNVVGVVDDGVSTSRYERNLPPAFTIKALNYELGVTRLDNALLSAVPGEPTMLCSQNGQPITYDADSYGFRNPEINIPNQVEFMALGDSFVEGLCLSDGEGIIGQFRERVDGSVFNTGSRGAGPLFELAVLGRYGPVFRPKVTLMAFFEGNDWENLENEAKVGWLAEALDPSADFGPIEWTEAQRSAAAPIISNWWAAGGGSIWELFRRQSILRNYFALVNTAQVLGLHYPKAMAPNPHYGPLLLRAAELTESWQGRLVVVYIPAHDRFAGVFPHEFVSEDLRRMVREAADQAGLPMIDLTETIERQADPKSLYAADSHFNAAGATLAAETIAAGISGLRPSRSATATTAGDTLGGRRLLARQLTRF